MYPILRRFGVQTIMAPSTSTTYLLTYTYLKLGPADNSQ